MGDSSKEVYEGSIRRSSQLLPNSAIVSESAEQISGETIEGKIEEKPVCQGRVNSSGVTPVHKVVWDFIFTCYPLFGLIKKLLLPLCNKHPSRG